MENPAGFDDWELLHDSDSTANPKSLETLDVVGSEEGAIKSDYFSLDPAKSQPRIAHSEEESEEGGVDSDNPSWIDPDSDYRSVNRSRGQLNFQEIKNSADFWSDVSSDGQRSLANSERSDLGEIGDLVMEVGSKESEGLGEKEEELVKLGGGDQSRERVWWKMPLEIVKFCIFRVRPVWSISIAAAILGVVMMGRRLYRMKQKTRSIPLKIAIDDKKASQFMARAARLNEAFSVVKRVPIIRPSLPAGSVTPWPVLSLR